jgi:hydrogenase maturation protease
MHRQYRRATKNEALRPVEAVGSEDRPSRVLVIGLGNPILGDDGVGWRVALDVQAQLPAGDWVEIDYLAVGGLSLMERMLGYSRVILVDSMQTGTSSDGDVRVFSLEELPDPGLGHSASAHDATLRTALAAAEVMGAAIPRRIDIVAIEAHSCHDFSEALSPAIAAAVPKAAEKVLELLGT